MAGKGGGGSWKVAYADFVTAMMAFFLVMWIGSQDASTRQSVANYFIDPLGVDKKAGGGVNDELPKGPVPKELGANTVRGSEMPTKSGEKGTATALLLRWLNTDPKMKKKWDEERLAVHESALRSPEVRDGSATVRDIEVRELSVRLKAVFVGDNPAKATDVYQQLMLWSIQEVNWDEIASELISK